MKEFAKAYVLRIKNQKASVSFVEAKGGIQMSIQKENRALTVFLNPAQWDEITTMHWQLNPIPLDEVDKVEKIIEQLEEEAK